LAWLGLAGLAWLGLAWLGLAWLGLAWQVDIDTVDCRQYDSQFAELVESLNEPLMNVQREIYDATREQNKIKVLKELQQLEKRIQATYAKEVRYRSLCTTARI
jgi:hypothetical protein